MYWGTSEIIIKIVYFPAKSASFLILSRQWFFFLNWTILFNGTNLYLVFISSTFLLSRVKYIHLFILYNVSCIVCACHIIKKILFFIHTCILYFHHLHAFSLQSCSGFQWLLPQFSKVFRFMLKFLSISWYKQIMFAKC